MELGFIMALTKAQDSIVQGRTVSVRPCLKKKTTKLNSTTFRSDCVSLKFESHKILPNHTFVKYLRIPFVPFSDSAILCDCSLT